MPGTEDRILDKLVDVETLLELLPQQIILSADQVLIIQGLSDLSESLGTVLAGEFRAGNKVQPGRGFTGLRMKYPAMTYDCDEYHFVGVDSDDLQVGINATNGKLYAGAGTVIADITGLYSDNFSAGSAGWKIDTDAHAEFEDATIRGELRTAILAYNEMHSAAGSLGIFKSSGKLKSSVTTVASPTTFNVDISDPETGHTQVFTSGDILRIKIGSSDSWMTISSASDQTTFWRYVCVLSNGTETTYTAGTGVVDYGPSGQGYLIMTADDTNAPFYSVRSHAGAPWTTETEVCRLGNLKGFLDYSADAYGIAIGEDQAFLKYDPTDGLRIKGDVQTAYDAAYGFGVWGETPEGDKDGNTQWYSLASQPIAGTVCVVWNGVWQTNHIGDWWDYDIGISNDYIVLTSDHDVPSSGEVQVSYIASSDRSHITQETVTSSGYTLYLANDVQPGSAQVIYSGVTLKNKLDYIESPVLLIAYTPVRPTSDDEFIVGYQVFGDTTWVYQEKPTGDIDGANKAYTLASAYDSGNLSVFLNGIHQATSDFVATDSTIFTMEDAPLTGDRLWTIYKLE